MAKYIQNNIQFTNVPISKKQMNMKRLFTMIVALAAIIAYASAQTLSVQPIEVQTGEQTEMVVNLTGGTSATALQFNLKLPEGVTAETSSITHGSATDGHTLSVQTLNSGDLLFILYSMDLKPFKDGELLRIPVTAGSTETTSSGKLYTVRTATVDAVSHTCAEATFSATVSGAYKLGDANGDGTVSVTDVTMTISHILGKTPAGFNKDAVDINGDGSISVTDVTLMINIILTRGSQPAVTYYYYAGWTQPTASNVDTIINETYPTSSSDNTQHSAGKKTTSKSSFSLASVNLYNSIAKTNYYVLVPTGQAIYDTVFGLQMGIDSFTSQGTITVGTQTHTIYKSKGTSRNITAIKIQ